MKNKFVLGLVGLGLLSCGGENVEEINPEEASFESEIYLVTEAYPELEVEAIPVMESLEICTTNDTVLQIPPCSNQFFRIFDYRPTKDLATGFIVEMIPGLYSSPVHQLVIIEDYFGKYRIVNQYLGHLLEMRTKYSGYNDLVIGYTDPDLGVVAIRHEWTKGKYEPVDVEEINNYMVKPEMKDSINNIFLPAFSAGH
jgi:hypothetical protein